MSDVSPILMWFRQDLRLSDNPALLAAAQSGRPVIPLYILDESPTARPLGAASRWWLDRSLAALADDLQRLGAPLILRRGVAQEIISALVAETAAGSVHWNRLYDGVSAQRDAAIKADLEAEGVTCRSFNAALICEPWEVKTASGGSYKVFTPFWRAARSLASSLRPVESPKSLCAIRAQPASDALEAWALHPSAPDWSRGFADWRPGERGAGKRLDAFLEGAISDYAEGRDRPGRSATSRLSPHLHFGEIGPRRVWAATQDAAALGDIPENQAECFLRELGWRDFNHHILFQKPEMTTENFNSNLDGLAWKNDPETLEAWRRGRTGYPIVDAGMRELWATGWMHNRVRMVVASFLTKDLLTDWRAGESWFWDTLVDADIANNVANWQWVAGCGADAAPFFRVFNPTRQGERFDPQGDYVRRWLPELAGLPDHFIHQPWRADGAALQAAKIEPGVTYPAPIIDHAGARNRALAAYGSLVN